MKLSELLIAAASYAKAHSPTLFMRHGTIRCESGHTLFRALAEKLTGYNNETIAYNTLRDMLGQDKYAAACRAFTQGVFDNNTAGRRARWVRRLLMRRLGLKESQEVTRYV